MKSKPAPGTGTVSASLHCAILDSPVGALLILASACGLREIRFQPTQGSHTLDGSWTREGPWAKLAAEQLTEYFRGERKGFDLSLDAVGTEFMQTVWNELVRIPFGETISYGELARRIGRPSAARAVGLANGKNPIPIVVPCHRVIGSNGRLTGFAGGLPMKERLLRHEASNEGPQPTLFPR